jgi:hypothetical protein
VCFIIRGVIFQNAVMTSVILLAVFILTATVLNIVITNDDLERVIMLSDSGVAPN